MKQMAMAALWTLLGVAASSAACAADAQRYDKPEAVVGTQWRMRVRDGLTQAVLSDHRYRIDAVSDTEVHIVDGAGQLAQVLDAADFSLKRYGERVFEPPLRRLQLPVAVGDRWDSAYRYDNPQCGPTQSKLSFKAVAWEDITLPAGVFHALRVESSGQWRSGCGADRQTHKQWYVPGLAVPVRQEDVQYFQGRIFTFEVMEMQELQRP